MQTATIILLALVFGNFLQTNAKPFFQRDFLSHALQDVKHIFDDFSHNSNSSEDKAHHAKMPYSVNGNVTDKPSTGTNTDEEHKATENGAVNEIVSDFRHCIHRLFSIIKEGSKNFIEQFADDDDTKTDADKREATTAATKTAATTKTTTNNKQNVTTRENADKLTDKTMKEPLDNNNRDAEENIAIQKQQNKPNTVIDATNGNRNDIANRVDVVAVDEQSKTVQ